MKPLHKEKCETLSDRLRCALDKLGITQAELGKRINVSRQVIQYLCRSNIHKSKFSYDIAEAMNINVDWLVTGKGDMLFEESSEKQHYLPQQKAVPILQWNQIDSWLHKTLDNHDIKGWTSIAANISPRSYALILKDNSMLPRFDAETTVIIDPDMSLRPPCFVIAYVKKIHDWVFRRLTDENGQKVLYAYNEAGYKQLPLSQDDLILGYLVEAKWSAL